jgi:cell division protein FtsQ
MDGQRRVARPVNRRPPASTLVQRLTSLKVRMAVRAGAVMFLGAAIIHGGNVSGSFEYQGSPFMNLRGKLAGVFGLAAKDINISGLAHHEPALVLQHIGVKPGGSMVGFDADEARILLESLDWVADATVQRMFPNKLLITLNEREPYAIWQMDGTYQVIDREGVPMSGLNPSSLASLPLVTGKGANTVVVDYVNHMEAFPDLMIKVQAAARVGERRWTLYLDNGVKIALPQTGVDVALQRVATLDAEQNLLSKGIRDVDLRLTDRLVVAVADDTDAITTGSVAKISGSKPR